MVVDEAKLKMFETLQITDRGKDSLLTSYSMALDDLKTDPLATLSYDDDIPYEEQHPTSIANDPDRAVSGLASRIGSTKVYLLSESSNTTRVAKVRW